MKSTKSIKTTENKLKNTPKQKSALKREKPAHPSKHSTHNRMEGPARRDRPPPIITESYFEGQTVVEAPVKSKLKDTLSPDREMSAKQQRLFDRLQDYKKKKMNHREVESTSNTQFNEATMGIHYDSIIPERQVIFDPTISMNLLE